MSSYVGLDWGGKGWIAVIADDEHERRFRAAFYPSILNAWRDNREAETMLVDVPIGLCGAGRRRCDELARSVLGTSRSSVFYTPVREAVYEDIYDVAGDVNESNTETSSRISTQAYHICPAIREVDGLLREIEASREIVRESHPEVCFAALAGESGLPGKTSERGLERRRELLEAELDGAIDLEAFKREYIDDQPAYARRFRASNRDDLLDAFVLAVTARGKTVTLPRDPPKDDHDIPMQIVAPEGIDRLT